MTDTKYGRIFTEKDLKLIVEIAIENDVSSEEELNDLIQFMDENGDVKFPPDEPIFVLRAKDRLALAPVRIYLEKCEAAAGVPDLHIQGVEASLADFDRFRQENPDRLNTPD